MSIKGIKVIGLTALILSAALGLFYVINAAAESSVCAKVSLAISQEATLEREAFDAALGITNEFPNYGLEDFRVDVIIKDAAGNPADAQFFVKVNSKEGITAVDGTGIVQPATTANVHWLIIPSTGAGGVSPLGLKYSVKADISYKLNGIYQTISTYEDYITVKPQPALKLEYLLPFEVFADEPLTENVVEPVEPFALGVRVTNVGYGTAKNFKIDSGTPDITDNKQGLAIDVNLLGTYLGPKKIADTLQIPFGDVASGGVTQAAWVMSTSLSGRFIGFNASFTHSDELGGQLTSLVQSATTYTLLKDVLVDLPGSDAQFDFLVNTTVPRDSMYSILSAGGDIAPDYILESGQAVPIPVTVVGANLAGVLGGANTSITLKLDNAAALGSWAYASVVAPADGKARLLSVVRSDGKAINTRNAWVSKHFNKDTLSYVYRLDILDYAPPAGAAYTLNFSRDAVDTPPAAVADLSAAKSSAAFSAELSWSATGEDGAAGNIVGGRYYIQASTEPDAAFNSSTAQVSFSTNTSPGSAQSYSAAGLLGNASYYFRLWLADTGGNVSSASNVTQLYFAPNPPRSLLFANIASSSITAGWAGGNNNAPIVYGVWVDTDSVDPAVSSSPLKDSSNLSYVFTGLAPNTPYSIYGLAKNPDAAVESEKVLLGSTVTLAALPGPVSSFGVFLSSFSLAWEINSNPAWTEYVVQISTKSDFSTLAAASVWNTAASHTFEGLVEGANYYARVKTRNSAGVETAFAALGEFKTETGDSVPPVVTALVKGKTIADGATGYMMITDTVTLTATDAGSGWKDTYYTRDVAFSTDVALRYTDAFTVPVGSHTIYYTAIDNAGNLAAVKSAALVVLGSVYGSVLVSGSPEVTFVSPIANTSVTLVPENSSAWISALAEAAVKNLQQRSNLYELGPDLDYPESTSVIFSYSRALLGGVPEAKLAIYEHFTADGWVKLPGQTLDTANQKITAPVSRISSLFSVFTEAEPQLPVTVSSAEIGVEFTPDYTGVLPPVGSAELTVNFTPDYAGVVPPASTAELAVEYTPSGYPQTYLSQDADKMVMVVYQGAELDGQPVSVTVSAVDAADSSAVLALAAAANEELTPLSGLYDLGPDNTVFTPEAEVYFRYDEAALGGIDEATINVYRYDDAVGGWQLLPAVTRNTEENWISVKTGHLCLFGLFHSSATLPDALLRVNGFVVTSGSTAYITTADSITITGNALTESIKYSIDVEFSTGTANVYSQAFTLEQGTHTVYYSAFGGQGVQSELKTALFEVGVVQGASETAISPSSGPIGVPFTITGSNFGNYVANYTRVLIGGAAAPLTLWTDTQLKGTIPGGLAAGTYDAVVERAVNGGVVQTQAVQFTVIAPVMAGVTPSSGAIGVPFTITGSGFGNYVANYTKVLLGGTTAALTLWTDTKIQGTVPGTLATGDYELVVERELNGGTIATSTVPFKVVMPTLTAIVPSSGAIGVGFTLTGSNFGNYVANFTRVLIGGTTAPLTLWTDSVISGTVPGALASGTYEVAVERELNGGLVRTSTVAFTLVAPAVTSVAPSSGAIGVPFTITGASFGNYVANFTNVLIGGATMPITLWSETKIQATVPGALIPGDYDLIVTRELNGGVITTQPVVFKVLAPEMAAITPSSGAIGVPFVITGASFGNYVANYTRVLIGGTTAPLTLWTDSKIQGTIPGGLAGGDNEVVVERALNGGVVRTSTFTFNVLTPELSAVAPSSGPIGIPFAINGAGFGNYVANYTKVLIGGATAPLTLWTDTKIQGTIPGSLAAGDYELVVVRALNGGEVRTSTAAFTVILPMINAVNPSTAAVIAPFTISGAGFGNYVANSTKVLINGATAQLTLWTDTYIQGKLPFLLNGTYPVQIQRSLNGGLAESGTAYITVAEPVISSMTPLSGAVGTVFNLYGASFGPYDATQTRVTIGGVACALSLWTDTTIKGTVLTGLAVGTYTVVAMRGQALSNPLAYTVPGAVRTSMLGPTSILQAEFKLGEVYVYPNPAKGGKVPVFHVEVGLADNVKLKVFTVAGQSVLERTLTGMPQAIDGKYAYEYAWEGHIASGVYYYTMEAERAGKKLKAKGKFAVVR